MHSIAIGKVTKLGNNCAWIDIGLSELAYLHIFEIWNRPNYKIHLSQDILFVNQVRDFEIVPDYNKSGLTCLSIRKIQHKIIYKRLEQIYQNNVVIYAKINRILTNGAIVDIEELLGFVNPFLLGYDLNSKKVVGKQLPLKIWNLSISENWGDFTLVHDCHEVQSRINYFSVGRKAA